MVKLFPRWAGNRPAANPGGSDAKRNPSPRSVKRPPPREVPGSAALASASCGRALAPGSSSPGSCTVAARQGLALGACSRPARRFARGPGNREAPRGPARPRPAPTAAARPWSPRALHPPAWAAFPRPFPRAAPAPGGRLPPGAEPGPSSSSRCPAPNPGCPAAEAAAVLTQTASWECCSPLGPAREKKNVFQAPSPLPGPDSSIYSP